MKYATIKLVFDRKKVASKKTKGLVQMEVGYMGKRKWISAGVKLYADQWNARGWVVNAPNQHELNAYLRDKVGAMETWIREHEPFSWEAFDRFLKYGDGGTRDFVDYVSQAIDERNDLKESTKRSQRKLLTLLRDFGRIQTFADLTANNIMAFDNYLHGRKIRRLDADGIEHYVSMRQQSVFSIHKIMKVYVNMAFRAKLLKESPYDGLHFKRGTSEPDRFLTEEEVERLAAARYKEGSVTRARDMFLFQCYTGISFADLQDFDAGKVQEVNGSMVYRSKRQKTGEPFTFVLLDKAQEILKKYGGKLPVVALTVYNRLLKRVAKEAGIEKPIASHWARRTAAVLLASHGVPYEVIAKILGHSSVVTTERFYADLMVDSIVEAMKKVKV